MIVTVNLESTGITDLEAARVVVMGFSLGFEFFPKQLLFRMGF